VNLRFWVRVVGLFAGVSGWDSVLGDCPGVSVVVEAEVDGGDS
jgi:hypothetical protein